MKKLKRILAMCIVISLIFVTMGCQKNEDKQKETPGSEEVHLTNYNYWVPDLPLTPPIIGVVQSFLDENPNIKMEFSTDVYDAYSAKMITLSSNGEMPNLLTWNAYSMLEPFAKAGTIMPLDELFEVYPDLKDEFLPGALEASTIDGKLYGLGNDADSYGFYYNMDMFAKAGLSDKFPETYDEFIKACQAIKDAGMTPIELAGKCVFHAGMMLQYFLLRFAGVDTIDAIAAGEKPFNCPEIITALTKASEFAKMGFFNTTAATDDESLGRQAFTSGNAAIYMIGSWEHGTMASLENSGSIGYANFPKCDGPANSQDILIKHFQDDWVMGANQTEEQKKALFEFFNYYYSPEQQQKLRDSGVVTVTKGNYNEEKIGKDYMRLLEVDNNAKHIDIGIDNKFPGEMSFAFLELGTNILVGLADPVQEAAKVQKVWEEFNN